MRNCGSELCIVIKHAHINAFAAIHFPWNASVLVFASIGSYIHTLSSVTIAIECSLIQFFSVTLLLRSLMLHASLAPATTQWTILMCTTGKSILQRTCLWVRHVLMNSNTILIPFPQCKQHACDMRLWCATYDATAYVDRRTCHASGTCDNEQHEACNYERTCTSFGMAIAAARLTSDGADSVHELAEEWRLRG